jgi:phage repressor protein C with HTH and peptisase S24 domain
MIEKSIGTKIKTARGTTSQKEFADEIGVSLATLSRYERGQTPVPSDVLTRICDATGCNAEWLLLGRGPRIAERPDPPPATDLLDIDGRQERIVKIPILSEIPAGFAESFTDADMPVGYGALGAIHVRDPRDENAFALVIRGNSMSPTLAPGDIVVVSPRRFNDLRFSISVVKLREEGVTVKHLKTHGDQATLVSENPEYRDIEVPLSEIRVIGRVIGWHHQVSG